MISNSQGIPSQRSNSQWQTPPELICPLTKKRMVTPMAILCKNNCCVEAEVFYGIVLTDHTKKCQKKSCQHNTCPNPSCNETFPTTVNAVEDDLLKSWCEYDRQTEEKVNQLMLLRTGGLQNPNTVNLTPIIPKPPAAPLPPPPPAPAQPAPAQPAPATSQPKKPSAPQHSPTQQQPKLPALKSSSPTAELRANLSPRKAAPRLPISLQRSDVPPTVAKPEPVSVSAVPVATPKAAAQSVPAATSSSPDPKIIIQGLKDATRTLCEKGEYEKALKGLYRVLTEEKDKMKLTREDITTLEKLVIDVREKMRAHQLASKQPVAPAPSTPKPSAVPKPPAPISQPQQRIPTLEPHQFAKPGEILLNPFQTPAPPLQKPMPLFPANTTFAIPHPQPLKKPAPLPSLFLPTPPPLEVHLQPPVNPLPAAPAALASSISRKRKTPPSKSIPKAAPQPIQDSVHQNNHSKNPANPAKRVTLPSQPVPPTAAASSSSSSKESLRFKISKPKPKPPRVPPQGTSPFPDTGIEDSTMQLTGNIRRSNPGDEDTADGGFDEVKGRDD